MYTLLVGSLSHTNLQRHINNLNATTNNMGRKVHAYDRTTFSSNAVKMQNTP